MRWWRGECRSPGSCRRRRRARAARAGPSAASILPAPLLPTRPTMPGSSVRFTSRKARTLPKLRLTLWISTRCMAEGPGCCSDILNRGATRARFAAAIAAARFAPRVFDDTIDTSPKATPPTAVPPGVRGDAPILLSSCWLSFCRAAAPRWRAPEYRAELVFPLNRNTTTRRASSNAPMAICWCPGIAAPASARPTTWPCSARGGRRGATPGASRSCWPTTRVSRLQHLHDDRRARASCGCSGRSSWPTPGNRA